MDNQIKIFCWLLGIFIIFNCILGLLDIYPNTNIALNDDEFYFNE